LSEGELSGELSWRGRNVRSLQQRHEDMDKNNWAMFNGAERKLGYSILSMATPQGSALTL